MRDLNGTSESSASAPCGGFAERLESWKEIAVYLRRAVSTVQRWERLEGLPVHRLPHGKLGSVYALPAELDSWWAGRGASLERDNERPVNSDQRSGPRSPWRRQARVTWGGGLSLLAAAGIAGWLAASWRRPAPPSPATVRFSLPIDPPDRLGLGEGPAVALAPDGQTLVYVLEHQGRTRFAMRRLASIDSVLIAGTEGGRSPFFSPNGRRLGFFADGKLKVVDLQGGAPTAVSDAPSPRGGAWGPQDAIVFAPSTNSGLFRVSAAGGAAQPLTRPRPEMGEDSHRWPAFVPGGRSIVFVVRLSGSEGYDTAPLAVTSLEDGAVRLLRTGGTLPRPLGGGLLLFARFGRVLAARLDPEAARLEGEPESVLEDVAMNAGSGSAHFATSANGVTAFVRGSTSRARRSLVWVDREGASRSLVPAQRPYVWPRMSPDGRHIAFALEETGSDLWVLDLSRGTLRRLTTDQRNSFPVWHPDGRTLTFSASGGKPMNLSELAVDGSSAPHPLLRSSQWQRPAAWTPDGRSLVYVEASPGTGQDLWLFTRGAKPRPLVRSRFLEGGAQISPDGAWLAYVSDESGRYEVYVRDLGGSLPRVQVSVRGGSEPVWSHDGGELYYRLGRELFAVEFRGGIPPQMGRPRRLFEGTFAESLGPFPNYDAWPGSGGFVMIHEGRPAMAGQIEVVLGDLGTSSTGARRAP